MNCPFSSAAAGMFIGLVIAGHTLDSGQVIAGQTPNCRWPCTCNLHKFMRQFVAIVYAAKSTSVGLDLRRHDLTSSLFIFAGIKRLGWTLMKY